MITVGMSTVIESPPRRVWRALTEPTELVAWDDRILSPIDPASPAYPLSGQRVRWRYQLGSVQVALIPSFEERRGRRFVVAGVVAAR